jgi:hypothetical protein
MGRIAAGSVRFFVKMPPPIIFLVMVMVMLLVMLNSSPAKRTANGFSPREFHPGMVFMQPPSLRATLLTLKL